MHKGRRVITQGERGCRRVFLRQRERPTTGSEFLKGGKKKERKKGIALQFAVRASFFVLLNNLYVKLDSRKKKAHIYC